jgi:hypothetical protein
LDAWRSSGFPLHLLLTNAKGLSASNSTAPYLKNDFPSSHIGCLVFGNSHRHRIRRAFGLKSSRTNPSFSRRNQSDRIKFFQKAPQYFPISANRLTRLGDPAKTADHFLRFPGPLCFSNSGRTLR